MLFIMTNVTLLRSFFPDSLLLQCFFSFFLMWWNPSMNGKRSFVMWPVLWCQAEKVCGYYFLLWGVCGWPFQLWEKVSLADHMQSLGNRAQNFPKFILLTSSALGQTAAPSPGDEGLQHLFRRLFLAGFLMNPEIGACAFLLLILFAQRTHGAPVPAMWPSDLACKFVKYTTRNQL